MDQSSQIIKSRISSYQCIARNGSPEHLDPKDVLDDLLCILIKLRMNQSRVVITRDAVAKSGYSIIDLSYSNRVWKRIPKSQQLLVLDGHGHQQTVLVTDGHSADDSHSRNGAVDNWDVWLELLLKRGEEVLGHVATHQAVSVGEDRKCSDFA